MDFDGFIGGAYLARSPNQNAQRCINLYVEGDSTPGTILTAANHERGKAPAMLLGTPGLRRFCTLPAAGGVRGLSASSGGRAFAVCGSTLYELLAGGTFLARGTLTSTSGVVSLADNGLQLILVDGTPAGYLFTLSSNAYAPIVSDAFYGADRVAFFDQYFVLNRPGTQQIYVSSLLDGATYAGLDFASAESVPDRIVAHEVERRELLVLGTRSGEVWFNAGTADFPLAPIQGTAFPYGCAAPQSLRAMGQFYWVGQDAHGAGLVLRLQGYQPERISTHALEFALQGYARIDDAIGYTMQREGHSWYVVNFPSAGATWAFDVATKLWSQLADVESATGLFTRSRVEHHCFAFNKHLVAGALDGRVYESSYDVFTLDGDPLVRERSAPFIHHDRRLLYHAVFELDMQAGVGLDGGVEPGTTPQALLQWSDDGGHTWSNEHWASLGAQGQYLTRAVWRRLGRSRQRAYRVRIADPVRVALIAARIEVT
jgi:hypothetical protein